MFYLLFAFFMLLPASLDLCNHMQWNRKYRRKKTVKRRIICGRHVYGEKGREDEERERGGEGGGEARKEEM